MKTELIINVTSHETRVALLENSKLVEFFVERPYDKRILGNIYKGIVKKIIPGLQAAFVDIGLEKNAFLHISDMEGFSENGAFNVDESDVRKFSKMFKKKFLPPIEEVLKEGQEILVQVLKEPIGSKGPRVTTGINIPGRFLVLLMGTKKIAISKKISDKSERHRLRKIVEGLKGNDVGFIIRTVSSGKKSSYLEKDVKSLTQSYNEIIKSFNKETAPVLLYKEMNLLSSVIRDLFSQDVHSVVVDSRKEYNEIVKYLKDMSSDLKDRVFYYRGDMPIFDNYHIEIEISKMLDRVVWLKKGAYLVIEHTEALRSIDVNSGKNVKGKNFEDFILSVNLEAAREIGRQLRLRDIGGLIIIDFIDMERQENRDKVFNELKNTMKTDRAKYYILNFSEFGLVQVTRQRVRPSILFTYSMTCPICKGLGRIDSPLTTVSKIEHWFNRARMWLEDKKFVLNVHEIVYKFITEQDSTRFKELEKRNRVKLILNKDDDLEPFEFKIINFRTGKEITRQFL